LVRIPEGFTQEYIIKQRERLEFNRQRLSKPLLELMNRIEHCTKCPGLTKSRALYSYGKPTFGYGNPNSFVVIIAQSPGWRGCGTTGFVFEPLSRTGKVFEDCLRAAGLTFEDVYTTNLVKCCPRGSETPTKQEILNCSPFCLREINLIKPYALIAVGKIASDFLVRYKLYRDYLCRSVAHPGYILRKGYGLSKYISEFSSLLEDLQKRAMKRKGLEWWLNANRSLL